MSSARRSPILPLIVVLIAGLAVRAAVTAQGWFYWDDLTLLGTARDVPLHKLLLTEHDGHLMPGSWLMIWLFAAATDGFNWPLAVALLTLGNAVAAGAVAYAAWRITPLHAWWVTGTYLLTPLTLAVSTWSAAAVNSLPLHALMAVWLAHGWLYLQRKRSLDLGIVAAAVLGACLFSERALIVAPFSLAVLAAWAWARGASISGLGKLAAALIAPAALWAVVYSLVIGNPRSPGAGGFGGFVHSGYIDAFFPTFVGAPWLWDRWHPGPPFAAPPLAAVVIGVLAVLLLVLYAARTRGVVALLIVLAYPLLPFAALAYARAGATTADEITQTLRHFAEVAVFLVLTLGIIVAGRVQLPGAVLLVVLTLSVLVSTVGYARSWADQPARDYFGALTSDLAGREEPIFDQAVPLEVLLPVMHPYNRLSALLSDEQINVVTRDPALVDGSGNLIPAELYPVRATEAQPGCAAPGDALTVRLDGPLMNRDWVIRLNTLAGKDTDFEVRIGDGPATAARADEGLHQLHIAVAGAGEEMTITSHGDELCLGRSEVGLLAPKR